MFGYFIRRVDKRFQLERQLGLLDDQQADAVARLERMFNAASEGEQDLDRPATPSESASPSPSTSDAGGATSTSTSGAGTRGEGADLGKGKKKDSLLRKYIESFDQQTLADMTRQVASLSGHMQCFHFCSICSFRHSSCQWSACNFFVLQCSLHAACMLNANLAALPSLPPGSTGHSLLSVVCMWLLHTQLW